MVVSGDERRGRSRDKRADAPREPNDVFNDATLDFFAAADFSRNRSVVTMYGHPTQQVGTEDISQSAGDRTSTWEMGKGESCCF